MYISKHLNTKATPQTSPIPGRKDQVQNSAGGYVFELDDWGRLSRWLILGSAGGSYYASEKKLTIENAECVLRCIEADGKRVVDEVVAISDQGRAPKNDQAIFALALALKKGDEPTRKYAALAVPKVCRIGTHVYQLVEAIEAIGGGWGRITTRAISAWFRERSPDQLAMNLLKYQQRNGWSAKDLLRLSHAGSEPTTPATEALFRYVMCDGKLDERTVTRFKPGTKEPGEPVTYKALSRASLPPLVEGVERAKAATSAKEVAKLVAEYGLPRECIPTNHLNSVEVWDALLHAGKHGMPITALIRNLGKMTSMGLIAPLSEASKFVVSRLTDAKAIEHGRVHPMTMLLAARQYGQGHGDKGKLTWSPDRSVVDALDAGFYLGFKAVEPTKQNWLLALDVSGSMCSPIAGTALSCREAAAALALVTMNTEPYTHCVGFTAGVPGEWSASGAPARRSRWGGATGGLTELKLSPKMRLPEAVAYTSGLPFGGTDCSLPMLYATARKLEVDNFVVFTDSETWAGNVQPVQALQEYRQKMGRAAKLVVVAMTSSGFTIADPTDPGMLDCVGFDTTTPQVMNAFALMGTKAEKTATFARGATDETA